VLWGLAAVCMLLMPIAGSKRFYRRTNLPLIEGWMFLSAAAILCVLGAIVDIA
jgi:hypothetical protein